MACPVCDGWAALLGRLGSLLHYRCRDCGYQWSTFGTLEDEE